MTENTKPTVLFVDDEPRVLTSMRMLFRTQYRTLLATSGSEALAKLKQEHVDVIVSDQRMPNMTGVELFREVRKSNDRPMRILLTGYSDLNAIISSINEGEIFRFVNKPWNNDELKRTIAKALDAVSGNAPDPGTHGETEEPTAAQPSVGVLVMDDDASMASKIQAIVGNQYQVHHASSLSAAIDILEHNNVCVLLSETRVEGTPITSLLNSLKLQQPELVSIILTERADAGAAIELINQGQIFRMIPKPIHESQCRIAIKSAWRQNQRLIRNPALRKRYEVETPATPPPTAMAGGLMDRIRALRSRLRASA